MLAHTAQNCQIVYWTYTVEQGTYYKNSEEYTTERYIKPYAHHMKPSERSPHTYNDTTTNKQFYMIESDPVVWRADRASTNMVRVGLCRFISWNERCIDVSAYPICGHNIGSNQDTCTDVALLPTTDHNWVPSYRS